VSTPAKKIICILYQQLKPILSNVILQNETIVTIRDDKANIPGYEYVEVELLICNEINSLANYVFQDMNV
jgi:hypothetical protein